MDQSVLSSSQQSDAQNGYDADYASQSADRLSVPLLEQLWRSVMANKWAIMAIVALCMFGGLIVTLLTTPLYTAESLIEISRKQANVAGVDSVEEADAGRDQEFYDTQYSLLEARSLAERVARDQRLLTDDAFFDEFQISLGEAGTGSAGQVRSQRERLVVETLLENISIQPIRGSSLVQVRFTSPNRALSSRIANSWVEQFIASNLDRRFSSTEDARDYLEEQLAVLRSRLEDSERNLVNYASSNEIVALSQRQDAEGQTSNARTLVAADLEAMSAELAQARADRIAAQSALNRNNGAREALANSAINGLRQRRALVAAERAKLLATFEPEYPSVEALTSELAELDRNIAREEGRVRSVSSSTFSEAQQRERDLTKQVDDLKRQFADENRDSIQYNIYQREVDTNRELYNGLLQRYKEIGVAGVGTNNVAIVDRAELPDRPSSPNLLLNLALALIAGLGLSAAYIFAREQIDQTLRDPSELKKLLGVPLLGTIPDFEDIDIFEDLTDPKSAASEAYFSIATNLSFLTAHGVPKSLALTSSQPNEGKTTSAFALANMLARMGKSVLLVDADMRNPSIHKILGTDHERGLSNYLSGEEDIATMVKQSGRKNLTLMPAGPIPPNPAELLAGARMQEFVAELSEHFEHIVFDAPPVLGIADAPLLASHVEGMIYTVEANAAKLRTIQSAIQRIHASNAHIFGAIVTKLDSRNASYGYGYGYGYGYSYGAKEEATA